MKLVFLSIKNTNIKGGRAVPLYEQYKESSRWLKMAEKCHQSSNVYRSNVTTRYSIQSK